jgi:hypothetical protein
MRSCDEHIVSLEKMGTRRPEDRVAFFVPRRNIETWIAYLEGESVDEEELKDYKTFKRGHSRTKPAKELARRCIQSTPLEGTPPSLVAACKEWKKRLG